MKTFLASSGKTHQRLRSSGRAALQGRVCRVELIGALAPVVAALLIALAWILTAAAQSTHAGAPHPSSAQKSPASNPSTKTQPASPPLFVDVTRAAGIDFHLNCGSKEKLYIVETQCGGAAAFDYDNDGWLDILLIDGSSIADYKAGRCHPPRLYHNNHDGTFTDVSAKSGLNFCGWGYGVAIGDYDNDGWEDVYITGFDHSALYHNNHDGTFTDVTAKAGVANAGRWGTSAAFGDYDNDGNLDLYVANYVDVDMNNLPPFGVGPFCQYRGIPVNCGPRGLKGSRDRLYHNNGDGTFSDVTEKLGIDTESYYGLGALWLDYDKDGCLDLYVANDSSPSLLYHNNCKGGFDEVGAEAGVAYSSDGHEQAGMGIDSADYDHDGWPDILKTNFSDDTNNLYHNEGGATGASPVWPEHSRTSQSSENAARPSSSPVSVEFTDMAGPAGIGAISYPFLGFGAKFLDYDNDGWPDIFIANGHVDAQVEGQSFGVGYAERPFLFHNLGYQSKIGKFDEIAEKSGPALARKYVARAALAADFWNRGRQDLLITVMDDSPVLLRNEVLHPGHWLRIKTIGHKSNRDGFGAQVEITAAGFKQYAEVRSNSSFESASDPRLYFGLGAATRADSIVIRWPSGQVEHIGPQAADQELVLEEGCGVVTGSSDKLPRQPGKR